MEPVMVFGGHDDGLGQGEPDGGRLFRDDVGWHYQDRVPLRDGGNERD